MVHKALRSFTRHEAEVIDSVIDVVWSVIDKVWLEVVDKMGVVDTVWKLWTRSGGREL